MKQTYRALVILCTLLVCLNSQNARSQTSEKWNGSCTVTFLGASTLHNFTGTVKTEPFTVFLDHLQDIDQAHIASQVTAKSAKMDTKNAKRDTKMHDVLQVAVFPNIVVDVKQLKATLTKPVMEGKIPRPTIIPFTLTIKGGKQQLTGAVSDWSYSNSKIQCTVSFPVSLKASHLVVPSVLGFIKVQDEIKVSAKLTLIKPK